MLFLMRGSLARSWRLVYGDDDGDGEGKSGNSEGKKKATLKSLVEEHGLQEELNTMMSSNRKGLSQKNQELVTQLTQLRDEATLTTQQKEELEVRIDELQTQFMGKEELAKRDAGKAAKNHAKDMDKLTSDANKWQRLYSTSTAQRAIMDAAVVGKALPEAVPQIVAILGQTTHIVEELDDAGQGSGKYKPIVKFNDIDGDGKAVVLDLSPIETIKRMKELPEIYGFMFQGEASGGLGGGAGAGGKKGLPPKLSEILSDPVKYQEWRKKDPDLDITKLRK